jgi:hypothetical protein
VVKAAKLEQCLDDSFVLERDRPANCERFLGAKPALAADGQAASRSDVYALDGVLKPTVLTAAPHFGPGKARKKA